MVSFGFVLLLQGIVLFVFLVVKVINHMKNKPISEEVWNRYSENDRPSIIKSQKFWSKVNSHFQWKIVYTVYMVFIVECLSFCVYNYFHESYDYGKHAVFVISLIFAIVYTVIIALLFMINCLVPVKSDDALDNQDYK